MFINVHLTLEEIRYLRDLTVHDIGSQRPHELKTHVELACELTKILDQAETRRDNFIPRQ